MLSATIVGATLGTNTRALWYLTRGFGLIDLVLLTATLAMGLTQVVRYARPGWPRFVIAGLHKNISLLALVFLAVHVVTAIADTYAPISIVSAFVPFAGTYRPIWLGLGALALDLLVALIITSLLRERIGLRSWKALHWTAYLCWPVAVVHGLGTGSDTKLGWVLAINAICVAVGIGAIWWRLVQGWTPANARRRALAVVGSLVVPLVVAVWVMTGPLRPGWARRAGTPADLLQASRASSSVRSGPASGVGSSLPIPLNTQFTGSQSERQLREDRLVSVALQGSFSGGTFEVILTGEPLASGGVELTGSQVTLGPSGSPDEYRGHVTDLNGGAIHARVSDSSDRSLGLTLLVSRGGGNVLNGTIEVSA